MMVKMRSRVILIIIGITRRAIMMTVHLTSIEGLPGSKSYAQHLIALFNYHSRSMRKISLHFIEKEMDV